MMPGRQHVAVQCVRCGSPAFLGSPCPNCGMVNYRPVKEDRPWYGKPWVWATGIAVVVVVVLSLFLTVGLQAVKGRDVGAEDALAKSVVRNAMTAMETAYVDTYTFQLDPRFLAGVEPSIKFVPAPRYLLTVDGVGSARVTQQAKEQAVSYYGGASSYSICTRSESGTIFGALVDKVQGSTVFVDGEGNPW